MLEYPVLANKIHTGMKAEDGWTNETWNETVKFGTEMYRPV